MGLDWPDWILIWVFLLDWKHVSFNEGTKLDVRVTKLTTLLVQYNKEPTCSSRTLFQIFYYNIVLKLMLNIIVFYRILDLSHPISSPYVPLFFSFYLCFKTGRATCTWIGELAWLLDQVHLFNFLLNHAGIDAKFADCLPSIFCHSFSR